VAAREQGLVRYIGVTGHNWPELAKAVATGSFDTVLCWYNCAMPEPTSELFPQAVAHDTGVVIMSTTRAGKLLEPEDAPSRADLYRYVLSHPAVHVALYGLRNVEDFCRLANALSQRATLSPDEREALERYGTRVRASGTLD